MKKEKLKQIPVGKAQNLIGQKFGKLSVLYRVENLGSKHAKWHCLCECGNEIDITGKNLVRNSNQACPKCYNRANYKDIDLIGQSFGELIVLEAIGHSAQKCQCSCGNIIQVETRLLLNKEQKSCGCKNTRVIDLTGEKFGQWTVLHKAKQPPMGIKNSSGLVFWTCQCECGTISDVNGASLRRTDNSASRSCGCVNSRGEKAIIALLKENNINFEKEKTFADFKYNNKSNQVPRYDFYLPDYNRLIEYDGIQHFESNKTFGNSKYSFEDRQKKDNIKNQYALSHNIILVRIPYWELDNLSLDMLLGDTYLVKE